MYILPPLASRTPLRAVGGRSGEGGVQSRRGGRNVCICMYVSLSLYIYIYIYVYTYIYIYIYIYIYTIQIAHLLCFFCVVV